MLLVTRGVQKNLRGIDYAIKELNTNNVDKTYHHGLMNNMNEYLKFKYFYLIETIFISVPDMHLYALVSRMRSPHHGRQ